MITIPVKELKKFVSLAQHIKDTRIIPIYGWVKIESKNAECTLSKSNGHSFIVFSSNEAVCGDDEIILVEEKVLYGYINHCSASFVEISLKGKAGLLDDKKRPAKFQTIEDPYPAIQPKENNESWDLDIDVLSALTLSKPHTLPPQDKSIREWNTFVHLSTVGDKHGVAGFNGFTFYFQIFKQKLPIITLDTDTISVISKFKSATYSVAGNYQIYDCDNVTYGFINPTQKTMDLTKLHENLSKGEYSFSVNRKSLVEFCESVIDTNNTSVAPTITVNGQDKKSSILLRHVGLGGVTLEETVWVEDKKKPFEKYIFDPKYILLSLKELSIDEIRVSIINEGFVFSSDEEPDYLGGLMKMSKL